MRLLSLCYASTLSSLMKRREQTRLEAVVIIGAVLLLYLDCTVFLWRVFHFYTLLIQVGKYKERFLNLTNKSRSHSFLDFFTSFILSHRACDVFKKTLLLLLHHSYVLRQLIEVQISVRICLVLRELRNMCHVLTRSRNASKYGADCS
jgi:hypothetical protein